MLQKLKDRLPLSSSRVGGPSRTDPPGGSPDAPGNTVPQPSPGGRPKASGLSSTLLARRLGRGEQTRGKASSEGTAPAEASLAGMPHEVLIQILEEMLHAGPSGPDVKGFLALAQTSKQMRDAVYSEPSPAMREALDPFAEKLNEGALRDVHASWKRDTAEEIVQRHPELALTSSEDQVRKEVLWLSLKSSGSQLFKTKSSSKALDFKQRANDIFGAPTEEKLSELARDFVLRSLDESLSKSLRAGLGISSLFQIDDLIKKFYIEKPSLKRDVLYRSEELYLSKLNSIFPGSTLDRKIRSSDPELENKTVMIKANIYGLASLLSSPQKSETTCQSINRDIDRYHRNEMATEALSHLMRVAIRGVDPTVDSQDPSSLTSAVLSTRNYTMKDGSAPEGPNILVGHVAPVLRRVGLAALISTGKLTAGEALERHDMKLMKDIPACILYQKIFDGIAGTGISGTEGDHDWSDPQVLRSKVDETLSLIGSDVMERLSAPPGGAAPSGWEDTTKADLLKRGVVRLVQFRVISRDQAIQRFGADLPQNAPNLIRNAVLFDGSD